ncbi:hypothetical protein IWX90DRAFT_131814 [Phyllosticta citrichinensis]|uniref:Uncharacterized protein n=1 Tax=Phyllosticta citrichinensis TaxID=1130410 RepID=A0ABR1Y4K2_9PEZI
MPPVWGSSDGSIRRVRVKPPVADSWLLAGLHSHCTHTFRIERERRLKENGSATACSTRARVWCEVFTCLPKVLAQHLPDRRADGQPASQPDKSPPHRRAVSVRLRRCVSCRSRLDAGWSEAALREGGSALASLCLVVCVYSARAAGSLREGWLAGWPDGDVGVIQATNRTTHCVAEITSQLLLLLLFSILSLYCSALLCSTPQKESESTQGNARLKY